MSEAWETLDWIGHDSYLAIGDASIPAPKQFEALQATDIEARVIDATKNGVAVVAAFTEADDNVPVEVQRNDQGKVISLRLCWTADLDELDDNGGGNWSKLTTLPLPRGACSVWDPFHGNIENGYVLDLEPSTYVVEVFYAEGDCLGMRLVATREAMTNPDDLQFTKIAPMELTQDGRVPEHQGFDAEPPNPELTTELLLIERPIDSFHGPWRIDGALVKEPDRDPQWVEGWIDTYWSADAKQLWDYFIDKGGGNGISWEIGFLRIASPGDAPELVAHYNDRYALENPFGLTEPATKPEPIVHDSIDEIEQEAGDPCEDHVHVDMPFAAADVLTWRLASELVRRHPEELWVIRTFSFDGFYDCLLVRRLPDPLASPATIAINRHGTHVKVGWFGQPELAPDDEPLLSWGDAYAHPDPRDWLKRLEETAGLPATRSTLPPSTPSSLVVRWIAMFLAMQVGSRPRWTAWNDWSEVDFGSKPADFDKIPDTARWLHSQGGGGAAARVLFVGTYEDQKREPRFALSTEGHLWQPNIESVELPRAYAANGRRLATTVVETAAGYLP